MGPDKLQNPALTNEKEKRKRKSEEEERRKRGNRNACNLSICKGIFGRKKKLLDGKSPFGRNIFNNPARYIYLVNVLILIFTLDAVIATHMNIILYSV